jgi:hypothetical protein
MSGYVKQILLERDLKLDSGREWYSDPIDLQTGDIVTVSATADENFYAGFFHRVDFHRYYGRRGEPFAFEFGSDSAAYTKRVVVENSDEYYLVLRVGVFSGTATIHVRIAVQRPRAGVPAD